MTSMPSPAASADRSRSEPVGGVAVVASELGRSLYLSALPPTVLGRLAANTAALGASSPAWPAQLAGSWRDCQPARRASEDIRRASAGAGTTATGRRRLHRQEPEGARSALGRERDRVIACARESPGSGDDLSPAWRRAWTCRERSARPTRGRAPRFQGDTVTSPASGA